MGIFNSKPKTLDVPRRSQGPPGRSRPSKGFLRGIFSKRSLSKDNVDLNVTINKDNEIKVKENSVNEEDNSGFDVVTSAVSDDQKLTHQNKHRVAPPRHRKPTSRVKNSKQLTKDANQTKNNDVLENILEDTAEKQLPPEVPKTKKPRVSYNSESDNDTRTDVDRDVFLSSLNKKIQSKNNMKGQETFFSLQESSEVEEEVDAVHHRLSKSEFGNGNNVEITVKAKSKAKKSSGILTKSLGFSKNKKSDKRSKEISSESSEMEEINEETTVPAPTKSDDIQSIPQHSSVPLMSKGFMDELNLKLKKQTGNEVSGESSYIIDVNDTVTNLTKPPSPNIHSSDAIHDQFSDEVHSSESSADSPKNDQNKLDTDNNVVETENKEVISSSSERKENDEKNYKNQFPEQKKVGRDINFNKKEISSELFEEEKEKKGSGEDIENDPQEPIELNNNGSANQDIENVEIEKYLMNITETLDETEKAIDKDLLKIDDGNKSRSSSSMLFDQALLDFECELITSTARTEENSFNN